MAHLQQPPTPECDKMLAVSGTSQKIGEFLEWLGQHGYEICTLQEVPGYRDEMFVPVHQSINQWLANYYGIDLKKIEEEKEALLEFVRNPLHKKEL